MGKVFLKFATFSSDTFMLALGMILYKMGSLGHWQSDVLFIIVVMYLLLRMKKEIQWCIDYFKEARKKKINQYLY